MKTKTLLISSVTAFLLSLNLLAEEVPAISVPLSGSDAVDKVVKKFGNDLLFYAGFDGNTDASVAAGKTEAVLKKDPEFASGKIGECLSSGMVRFDGSLNLTSTAGSIAFWMQLSRPAGRMSKEEGYSTPLIATISEGELIVAKMDYANNALAYCYLQGNPAGTIIATGPKTNSWKKGQWHLMVIAWKPGSLQISVDGASFISNTKFPTLSADDPSRIDISAGTDKNCYVLVDELMTFNRPLTDEEVTFIWETLGKTEPLPSAGTSAVSASKTIK